MKYFDDQQFDSCDFTLKALEFGEYDNCHFKNCRFSKVDLSEITFNECSFEGCDLSLAVLTGTSLSNVKFRDCKMLGLRFDECKKLLFSVDFQGCQLNHSSFFGIAMRGTRFIDCSLLEVDLVQTQLGAAVFQNCDLSGVMFDRTNLEKADLSSARNFSLDPEKNRIRRAKFSAAGLAGLLEKYELVVE